MEEVKELRFFRFYMTVYLILKLPTLRVASWRITEVFVESFAMKYALDTQLVQVLTKKEWF